MVFSRLLLIVVIVQCILYFQVCESLLHKTQFIKRSVTSYKSTTGSISDTTVTVDVPLGEGLKPLQCKFQKIFANSTILMFTYDVPFSLDVEKPPKNFPAPIFKSSKNPGKEETGDLLRAVTCWSQGFNAAGVTSDFSAFAGNLKWRKSVYDCTSMQWDRVVDALLSNTSERSKSVTLVVEREIE